MAKITCMDYGFDCSYVVEGEVEHVIGKYQKHSTDEHGIEYSVEALTQVILRQQGQKDQTLFIEADKIGNSLSIIFSIAGTIPALNFAFSS